MTSTAGVRAAGRRPDVPRRDPAAPVLRAATAVSVAAVVAVLVVGLVAPSVWQRWPWLPFAVGLVAGVPHGALDHLVPWWTGAVTGRAHGRARTGAFLLGYVALAAGVFLAARTWPVPALVVLLGASVVHFGTGETEVADHRTPARATRVPRWPGFGATTVVLPFVAWPATVAPVLDVLAPGSAPVLLDPAVLRVAAVATAVAVASAAVGALRAGRPGQLAELALLVALFLAVPPLAAFGVWFGAWHGVRHLARLVAVDPANALDLAAGRLGRPVARLAAHAALPTGAVLAALGVLLLLPGAAPVAGLAGVVDDLVPVGLALVLALTVPHMLVVALLDVRLHRASMVVEGMTSTTTHMRVAPPPPRRGPSAGRPGPGR